MNEIVESRMPEYGDPVRRLRCAERLSVILSELIEVPLLPGQAKAVDMILDKLTRICISPAKRDSWEDIQGYAEIGLMSITRENGPVTAPEGCAPARKRRLPTPERDDK